MEPDPLFLRWLCGDLLDDRARLACVQWLVLDSLGLSPLSAPPPQQPVPQRLALEGLQLGVSIASAMDERPSFPIAELAVDAWLFALLQGQDGRAIQPLQPAQWRFWLVPVRQLHAGRRSISLRPLIRAQGEGLVLERVAGRLQRLVEAHAAGCPPPAAADAIRDVPPA